MVSCVLMIAPKIEYKTFPKVKPIQRFCQKVTDYSNIKIMFCLITLLKNVYIGFNHNKVPFLT